MNFRISESTAFDLEAVACLADSKWLRVNIHSDKYISDFFQMEWNIIVLINGI